MAKSNGANKKRKTTDLVEVLHDRYFSTPEARTDLEEARATAAVARQLFAIRSQAGLTQKELAARVGTTHSVISRLEDDDYEGHSMSMLRRIARALGKRVEIRFVPAPENGPD